MHRVLGIDPGLANTGFAIVQDDAGKINCLYTQTVVTSANESIDQRLKTIFTACKHLIDSYQPHAISMENSYVSTLPKAAILVAQVRGALILTAALSNLSIFEYTPRQVKKSITGFGNAPKQQVRDLIDFILTKKHPVDSYHVADAIALSITHIHNNTVLQGAS